MVIISGVGSRSGFCPVAMSMIDLASWFGSRGRLGCPVICREPPDLWPGEFVVAAYILDIACFNQAFLMVRRHFPLRPVLEGPEGFHLGDCDIFKRSDHFPNMRPESVIFQPGSLPQSN